MDPQIPFAEKKGTPILGYVAGVVLVAVLSIGAGIAVSRKTPHQEPIAQTVPQPTPRPTLIPLFLSLDKSQSNAVVINGEMFVSGMTLPNTTVVIYSPIDVVDTQSDTHGHFEESILIGNENTQVSLTAFSETGEERTITIDVNKAPELSYVGRPQVLGKSTTAGENGHKNDQGSLDATSSADGDRGKPAQAPTPKYKTADDFMAVKRASFKPAKIGLSKMKDYLATDATQSATLTRVLPIHAVRLTDATNSAVIGGRKAIAGIITAIGGNSITISHLIDRSRESKIYYNADTVVSIKGVAHAIPANLAVAMRVVAVGERAPDGVMAVHIHVIPGNANGALNNNPVSNSGGSPSVLPTSPPSVTPVL